MQPHKGAMLLSLLCLVLLATPSTSDECEVPTWDFSAGPNPFRERDGKVVLVAFHKGYCGYCVRQTERLYQLKNELMDEGYPDIDMIIINGGEEASRSRVSNLINASPLPVIQDTPTHVLYQQVFGGARKDDFLVYDKCSQAAVYIPSPHSDLDRTITKLVLKAVHDGRHSCYCSHDYAERSPDNMMVGDDPGGHFYQAHDMNWNMLHCNPNDNDCIQFQRVIEERGHVGSIGSGRGVLRLLLRRMRQGLANQGRRDYIADIGDREERRDNQDQIVSEGQRTEIRGGGRGFGGVGSGGGFGERRGGRFSRRRYTGSTRRHGHSGSSARGPSQNGRPVGSV